MLKEKIITINDNQNVFQESTSDFCPKIYHYFLLVVDHFVYLA